MYLYIFLTPVKWLYIAVYKMVLKYTVHYITWKNQMSYTRTSWGWQNGPTHIYLPAKLVGRP